MPLFWLRPEFLDVGPQMTNSFRFEHYIILKYFFSFLFIDIIVFFVLYFDHWYVLYMILNIYPPWKMNGNLFLFNCIDICSKLRSSIILYYCLHSLLLSKMNHVSGFYNMLVYCIFT